MMDVAIVGVGLHPFGRFGDTTAIEMGAVAIRRALADAGVEWKDIEFAFAGSYEVDNPDAVVALMGLTGIPFTDVYNGCATAASALTLAANTIRLGESRLGIAVGMDKHPPGAFGADPRLYACPEWYGDVGQFVTTKFFGMKINKYMQDHGISSRTLARVVAKSLRNGALNPNAFRRKPMSEDEILGARMLNYPLTQYMFCSPDEGAAAVVLCRADKAHLYTDTPIYLRASVVRTRRLGAFLPPLARRFVRHPALIGRAAQTAVYPLMHRTSGNVASPAELLSIMVEPAARSHGIGALLVAALKDECRRRGIAALEVTVDAANDGAQRFYVQHGFGYADTFILYGRSMRLYRAELTIS